MFKDIIVQSSDIHLSKKYLHYIESPLKEFRNYIITNKPKYTIIAGDYFDKRMNSDDRIFSKSIGYLIEMAKNSEFLIVLNGTYNHDNTSLRILREIAKVQTNIYYFDKLTTETIGGRKFLLIPEEYPEDPEEYYKNIYNEKIDYIVGHGELEGAKLHSGIDNRKLKGWKFNVSKLESTGCLWNMWGHLHLPQILSNITFYSGSLARYKYGEEEDKGFTVMQCDGSSKEFIKIKSNLNLLTLKEEEVIKYFDNEETKKNIIQLLNNKNTFLRFKGNEDSDILKELKENSINEVFTSSVKVSEELSTLENYLLYKGIEELKLLEQYDKMIEKDLESKITKKQKIYLQNDKMIKKLKIIEEQVLLMEEL